MSKNRSKENGSKNDDWETPQYILDMVKEEFGEFFDPCPLHAKFNGLEIEWGKVNYINPPYNSTDKPKFIEKALLEHTKGKVCILLIPSTTETKSFFRLWKYAKEIRFLHKRVKFKGFNSKGIYVTDKTGQSGSILVILDGCRGSENPIVKLIKHQ